MLALPAALLLAGVPLLADLIGRWTPRANVAYANFAGGASLSYVFLYLLFQLSRDGAGAMHALVPLGPAPLETLFLVLLGAVAAFHVLYSRPAPVTYEADFWSDAIYNVLVGFALAEEALEGPLALGLYTLALGLHLVFADHALRHHHAELHLGIRRVVIAAGPLLGATTAVVLELSKGPLYFPLAIVAGGLVVRVLQRELPRQEGLRPLPYVVGLVAYGALILATWTF